jgi:hypothetical protein
MNNNHSELLASGFQPSLSPVRDDPGQYGAQPGSPPPAVFEAAFAAMMVGNRHAAAIYCQRRERSRAAACSKPKSA